MKVAKVSQEMIDSIKQLEQVVKIEFEKMQQVLKQVR